jgi:hypothetical protein
MTKILTALSTSLADGLDGALPELELIGVVDAPGVTHLSYRVVK